MNLNFYINQLVIRKLYLVEEKTSLKDVRIRLHMMNLILTDFNRYVVMVKRNQVRNLFMEIENLNYQMI